MTLIAITITAMLVGCALWALAMAIFNQCLDTSDLPTFLRILKRPFLSDWAETRARWQGSNVVRVYCEVTERDRQQDYTRKKAAWSK